MRAFRDIFHKFLNSKAASSFEEREMPFFYVRNQNFIALFKYEEDVVTADVCPSEKLYEIFKKSNPSTLKLSFFRIHRQLVLYSFRNQS